MSKDSMLLVNSTWNDKQTFRTLPVSDNCPYIECIWEPEQKILVVISKITKTAFHMVPKLDDNGDPISVKTKRPNGKSFKEEKKSVETFQEYYIEDIDAMILLFETTCINAKTFDFKSFLNSKKVTAEAVVGS
jgi:hypothetical protein